MALLLSRFWSSLRLSLLAASVLLVLGLNQRTVSVLRLRTQPGQSRLAIPPKVTVVKQKVLLEATASLLDYVAPTADAWLPLPFLSNTWRPALRHALAIAQPTSGLSASEVFRVRLLAVVLSPQAP